MQPWGSLSIAFYGEVVHTVRQTHQKSCKQRLHRCNSAANATYLTRPCFSSTERYLYSLASSRLKPAGSTDGRSVMTDRQTGDRLQRSACQCRNKSCQACVAKYSTVVATSCFMHTQTMGAHHGAAPAHRCAKTATVSKSHRVQITHRRPRSRHRRPAWPPLTFAWRRCWAWQSSAERRH